MLWIALAALCGATAPPRTHAAPLEATRTGLQAEEAGTPAQSRSGQVSDFTASVGFAGVWKVGHVTPVHVTCKVSAPGFPAGSVLEVETVDGEGVEVTYRQSLTSLGNESSKFDAWIGVSIGRADQPITIRLSGRSGESIYEQELEATQYGRGLPATQPLVLAIGNSLGVETTSRSSASGGLPSFSTVTLYSARDVPTDWRSFLGVDLLVIATAPSKPSGDSSATTNTEPNFSQPTVAESLSEEQWLAITEFIDRGGNGLISLGPLAERLRPDSAFRDLLPGKILDTLSGVNPAPLEASTSTDTPLAPLQAVRLEGVRGVVELSLLDRSGKPFPWWVRYAHGRGYVHFIGSDLDSEILHNWKDRRLIWEKLLSSFWTRSPNNEGSAEQDVSGSTYLGYDDLIGQLRATLDYFPTAHVFSFGQVSLMLIAIMILVGPVDYWFSVRWLKRPELSWYFAGSVLLASSLGLIALERSARPTELLMNSATIVDYVPEQKRITAQMWTHLYSSRARMIDAELIVSPEARQSRLDWQGLPGKGLGGMESNLISDRGLPPYWIDEGRASRTDNSAANANPSVHKLALTASGTKCLTGSWSLPLEPTVASELKEMTGIDQLEGSFGNPLDVDLLDAALVYHNWIYQLPTRLKPGSTVTLSYETLPKDLGRRLNRRRLVSGSDLVTPWDPADRESLDRLLEVMMFYKAAGGPVYTKLAHRFQPHVDMSNLALTLDRAVLYGRLEKSPGHLVLKDLPAEEVIEQKSATWCRIVLPVSPARRR